MIATGHPACPWGSYIHAHVVIGYYGHIALASLPGRELEINVCVCVGRAGG